MASNQTRSGELKQLADELIGYMRPLSNEIGDLERCFSSFFESIADDGNEEYADLFRDIVEQLNNSVGELGNLTAELLERLKEMAEIKRL